MGNLFNISKNKENEEVETTYPVFAVTRKYYKYGGLGNLVTTVRYITDKSYEWKCYNRIRLKEKLHVKYVGRLTMKELEELNAKVQSK